MLNSFHNSPYVFINYHLKHLAIEIYFFDLWAFEMVLTRSEANERIGSPVPFRRLLSESCSCCVV